MIYINFSIVHRSFMPTFYGSKNPTVVTPIELLIIRI